MARSLWTGSLSFGLVNVPVQLISGVRDLDLHFRQLHEPDNTPIDVQRWCSEEQVEVPYDEIARSYEFEDGESVVVSDEELDALEPQRTRTIDIEHFVELRDVDPIYFDHPYLVAPAAENEGALRAYRLLLDVMSRTQSAALGRFVMRTKEYLAIVRPRDGVLALTTMLFHDEVRPVDDVRAAADVSADDRHVELALRLVEGMTVDWQPERYRDCYRERLLKVVERKRKGSTIKLPKELEEPRPVPDLMAALRESLQAARAGTPAPPPDRRPAGRDELRRFSRDELYERARERDIHGRSSMTKDELVDELSR
ncbi:MAG: Ku protein [Actinobacteria bacterium]|nr:Ku protein [Actinomycetota bacterium]